MSVTPAYIEIREPSYNASIKGRLLARYDPARRILRIKRHDGPEVMVDLAEFDEIARQSVTQTAQGVL